MRRFACPRCGRTHSAAEHGVLACRELSSVELRRFDRIMLEEIGEAALAGEFDEIRVMANVLAGVRARLAREAGNPLPTRARAL